MTELAALLEELRRIHAEQREMRVEIQQVRDAQIRLDARMEQDQRAADSWSLWHAQFVARLGSPDILETRISRLAEKAARADNHRLATLSAVGAILAIITAAASLVAALG